MRTTRMRHHLTALLGALITLSLVSMPVLANHSWGSYHWQRSTVGTVSLKVGDNVSGQWETMLPRPSTTGITQAMRTTTIKPSTTRGREPSGNCGMVPRSNGGSRQQSR